MPIEERWEAIGECEALFASSHLRVRTENIGLAVCESGLELVRIGPAAYPEFAGWRYGRRLRLRWIRWHVTITLAAVAGTLTAILTGAIIFALAAVVGIVAFAPLLFVWDWLQSHLGDRPVASINPADGHVRQLLTEHVGQIELLPASAGAPWGVSIPHRSGSTIARGVTAKQLLGQVLARINGRGASQRQVNDSVSLISVAGGPDGYIAWAIEEREARRRTGEIFRDSEIKALGLTDSELLALEISINEDVERIAASGELSALQTCWRDAERVASIADNLLLPAWIREALQRLRRNNKPPAQSGADNVVDIPPDS